MTQFISVIITLAGGVTLFVVGQAHWAVAVFLLTTLMTRFRADTSAIGKLFFMLFVFSAGSLALNEFGIHYPYSLILVLALLVVLIFYEGPEWGRLYFGPGDTGRNFRFALLVIALGIIAFCGWIWFRRAALPNPVPAGWPTDVLLVLGLGFAIYIGIVEEILFRSFILQRAREAVGDGAGLLLQASFYGLLHFRAGIPGNVDGAVLSAIWGLLLGLLVRKSGSIYLSMLAQTVVTLAIYIELVFLAKI